MWQPFIKVCGLQSVADAQAAIDAGANAIGLLMGITHVAPDKIDEETGRAIAASIRGRARSVMVTHLTNITDIARMAAAAQVDVVQLHNAVSPGDARALRAQLPGMLFIKAVHVDGPATLDTAKSYEGAVDMLLLDTRTADRLGGTGMTHDWSISRAVVDAARMPVILAGGLNPANVADAVARVNPAGIDANSGLEHADGSKDAAKIRAFAAAGRSCVFDSAKAAL